MLPTNVITSVLRWTAAAVLEALNGLRRLKGHADMPKPVAALRAREQQLGSPFQQGTSRRMPTPEDHLNVEALVAL